MITKTLVFLWRAFQAICILAGIVVVTGAFFQQVVLGIHIDKELSRRLSPDGNFIASVYRQDQLFDIETKVVIQSKAAPWEREAVVIYETVSHPQLSIAWKDVSTLEVSIPCVPPNMVRPSFYGGGSGARSRIIIETVHQDTNCQFGRGFIPDEGFPGESDAP